MNRAVTKFVATVSIHFPRPKFGGDEVQEEAWLTSMTDALSGFSDETLSRAARHINRMRDPKKDGSYFPKPRECIAACLEVHGQIKAEQTPLLQKVNTNDWSDDRLSLAFDLMKGQMGMRAARENWIGALYAFCRKNARLPDDHELPGVIASGRWLDEDYEKCSRGEYGSVSKALGALAETLLSRRKDLSAKILGTK